jgi:hypothetical protein
LAVRQGNQILKKGETIMRYAKPSIVKLGAASDAIQQIGTGKPLQVVDAIHPNGMLTSGGSYDLDE